MREYATPAQTEILELLAVDGPLTADEIANRRASDVTVERITLRRMLRTGLITRTGRGRRAHPYKFHANPEEVTA